MDVDLNPRKFATNRESSCDYTAIYQPNTITINSTLPCVMQLPTVQVDVRSIINYYSKAAHQLINHAHL